MQVLQGFLDGAHWHHQQGSIHLLAERAAGGGRIDAMDTAAVRVDDVEPAFVAESAKVGERAVGPCRALGRADQRDGSCAQQTIEADVGVGLRLHSCIHQEVFSCCRAPLNGLRAGDVAGWAGNAWPVTRR
ncbi:hypothetical protein D3C81_1714240 [compost metagenome]